MRNEVLRKKKAAKAARIRKDYVRRRNMNDNRNLPSVTMIEDVKVFKTKPFERVRDRKTGIIFIQDRRPQLIHTGYKKARIKVKKPRYHAKGEPSYVSKRDEYKRLIPMIPYPPRPKNKKLTNNF